MSIVNNSRLIVHLCGTWFDEVESEPLACCPRLWTDADGQQWVAIGNEAGQRVRAVEHIRCLAKVVVEADEVFVVDRVDYEAMLG
jgi:hypothetical protein